MALTKVSTDGVKDDAITKTKIPANQIEASELADNAVDTNAIANNAVTAGKLASGVQTTINNNADNRVITGSGTANTLEGESGLIFDGTNLGLGITPDSHNAAVKSLQIGTVTNLFNETSDDYTILGNNIYFHSGGTNKRIKAQECSRIMMNAGELVFERAGADSADSNITFTQPFKIDSNGFITLKGEATSDNARMQIRVNDTQNEFRGSSNSGTSKAFAFYASNTNTSEIATLDSDGLKFGTDTAAANALDDYEEGTYTPTVTFESSDGGNKAYAQQGGSYTKIGNLVRVNFHIELTNKGTGSGNTEISLPFTPANLMSATALEAGGLLYYFTGLLSSVSFISLAALDGVARCRLYGVTGTQDTSMNGITYSFVANTFNIRGSVTFLTAS